jgi:hypothetical protein
MRIKLSFLALIFSILGYSQGMKFGEISSTDFELNAIDSLEHDAILIYRNVHINFDYVQGKGFIQKREVHERIKINNEKGIDFATKKIRLWNRNGKTREKLKGLKGATFNLVNGEILRTKLKSSGVFDNELDDRWKTETFTMPNVRSGSVIEYTYVISSPFPQIDDINLQYEIPILNLNVKVEMVEYYLYNVLFNPRASFTPKYETTAVNRTINLNSKTRTYNSNVAKTNFSNEKVTMVNQVYTLSEKNVPAIEAEPMSGNLDNYRSKMIVELSGTRFPNSPIENYSTTWEAVSKSISDNVNFGGQLKQTGFYKNDLKEALNGLQSDFEKTSAIFQLVKSKVKWNDYYGKYAMEGIKEAYNKGSGNVADVNLLLVSMLRKAGIKVNPVLISSKNNGIPLFPTNDGFNYVIAHVNIDGSSYLLDATEPFTAPNILPLRAINWQGRLIGDNGTSRWINLKSEKISSEIIAIDVILNEDMSCTGNIQRRQTENIAYTTRAKYALSSDKVLNAYLTDENNGLTVSNEQIEGLKNSYKPLTFKYEIDYKGAAEKIGDKIFINPLLFESIDNNPFKGESRKLPVDLFYPYQTNTMVTITIPDGYKVVTLPESQKFVFGDKIGAYTYLVKYIDNRVSTRATFDMKSSIVIPEDYKYWREFFSSIVEKDAQKVVLKKI